MGQNAMSLLNISSLQRLQHKKGEDCGLGRIWKEAVAAYFNILTQNFHVGNGENDEIHQ
jgi:hypothetical protein